MKGKILAIILIFIVVIVFVFIGLWNLKRGFNYSFGYESQVKQTVCEMVKPEHLKNPKDCK